MMFPKNKKTFRVSFGSGVVIVPMDKVQAAVEEALKDMDISGGSASVEMRVSGEYIQYSTDGKRWYNLIALSDLRGAPGADYVLTDADIAEIAKQVAATVEPDLVIGFNRAHVLLDTISASTFYVESGSLSAIKELVLSGKSPNIKIRCVFSGAGNHTEYNFTPSGHYYNFKTGDDYIIIEFVARFGSSLKEYTMKATGEDIELNRFTEARSANIVPELNEDTPPGDALSAGNVVMTTPQDLTVDQQTQARDNIGAVGTDELTGAVATALETAKASGEFKGDPGEPGEPGADYVLTDADIAEIAKQVAELVDTALLAIIGEVSE